MARERFVRTRATSKENRTEKERSKQSMNPYKYTDHAGSTRERKGMGRTWNRWFQEQGIQEHEQFEIPREANGTRVSPGRERQPEPGVHRETRQSEGERTIKPPNPEQRPQGIGNRRNPLYLKEKKKRRERNGQYEFFYFILFYFIQISPSSTKFQHGHFHR